MAKPSKRAKRDHTIRFGRCAIRIKRLPATNEWRVTETINGRITGGKVDGGYYTNDKQDARSTAAAMIRRLRQKGACR
jgi:hypothetical protein